jgi:hypothetical protein
MTQELEASGFDAFAGMTLPPAPPPTPVPAVTFAAASVAPVRAVENAEDKARAAREAEERAALEQARQLLTEREQAVAVARERVRARADEQRSARQAHDQVQASVRKLEHQLSELRASLEQHTLALARSDAALDDAHAAQKQAEGAAAAARQELALRGR